MSLFFQTIVSAIAAGAVYTLIALGFSLIYRTSKVINFAQGDLAMFGAYVNYSLIASHIPRGLSLLGGAVAAGALTVLMERAILRPLYRRSLATLILATVAFAIALEGVIQLVWGSQPLTIPSIASQDPWRVAGLAITPTQVAMVAIGVAVVGPLLWIVTKTKIGRAMRGTAQDPEVVTLFGVSPSRTYMTSFLLGGLVAGLAGVLIGAQTGLRPTDGLGLSAVGFSAAVLGGLGSLPGAVLGGCMVALLINLGAVYIDPGYATGLAYAAMAIVLLVRVRGLLGDDIEAVRQV